MPMPIPMSIQSAAGVLLCVLLGACATSEPYAFLNGQRYSRTDFHTSDTVIAAIDGRSPTRNHEVLVTPGLHRIELVSISAYHAMRTLDIDVAPCTRYWFQAYKESRLMADFIPQVNYSEPISGCHVPPSAAAAR
jgi:hypothetical protein